MDDIKYFILKSKDIPLIKFQYKKQTIEDLGAVYTFYLDWVNEEYRNLLPYSLETSVYGLEKWIVARRVPKNRQFVDEILSTLMEKKSLKHPMDYIELSFGLSLNDSYWIVPDDGKEYLWRDFNLYDNKFSEILSLVAFTGYKQEVTGIRISPEYTTDGMLAKCWTTLDNQIVLLKKSSEHYKVEAYVEYYMSQIAEVMNFEHISYNIIKYHDSIASSCFLFTSEKEGFVPMYQCLKKDDRHKKGVRLLESILEITGREFIEDLMVFDSLIYNTDRHLGNFGMMVENDTGKCLRPAPIFDNGNSILSFLPRQEISQVLKNYTSRFEIDFDLLSANLVSERHREGLKKLETFKFKRHPFYNLEGEILEKGEQFIQARAKLLTRQLDKKRNTKNPCINKEREKSKDHEGKKT